MGLHLCNVKIFLFQKRHTTSCRTMRVHHTFIMSLAILPWLPLLVSAYPMDVEHDITHDEWNEISDILKDVTLPPENSLPLDHPNMADTTQKKRKYVELSASAYPTDGRSDITYGEWNDLSDILQDRPLSFDNNIPNLHQPAIAKAARQRRKQMDLTNETGSVFCQPCQPLETGGDQYHCVEPKAGELNGYIDVKHGEHRANERPHTCSVPTCGKAFKFKCKLREHAKIHSDERPYQCNAPGCSRAFKIKGNLSRHEKTAHTDERPYQCNAPGCSRAFKTRSELLHHGLVHSGQRRFKCEQPGCGKTFKHKKSLKSHAYRSHVIG